MVLYRITAEKKYVTQDTWDKKRKNPAASIKTWMATHAEEATAAFAQLDPIRLQATASGERQVIASTLHLAPSGHAQHAILAASGIEGWFVFLHGGFSKFNHEYVTRHPATTHAVEEDWGTYLARAVKAKGMHGIHRGEHSLAIRSLRTGNEGPS
eukprot:5490517-Heterocapsa_arctica.AAC.1